MSRSSGSLRCCWSAAWRDGRRRSAAAQTVVGVTATEIKIGNTNPYSGPASAYGTIGKAIGAYFKKVNDEGGVNGRKINYITYDDALQPAQGRGDGPQAGRAGPGGCALPDPRHPDQHRHPQVREPAEGAAPLRGHRRHQVERPEELPVDDGVPAELPDRGPRSTRRTCSRTARTPRSASCTRTTTTGRTTCKGFEDGLGDAAKKMIVHEAELRGDRSHDRLADRQPEEQRRQRVLQHHDPEVRGAGHQEGPRHRLEAAALPEQRVELARHRAEAGRPRGLQGPDHRALHEGRSPIPSGRTTRASRTGSPS